VELLPEDWDPRCGAEDVCLIFADISGYSAFVADGDDDAAMSVLAVLDQRVEQAMAGRRGVRVVKRLGDGVMMVARRSTDAVDTAVSMVASFDATAHERGWPVRLRAGTHRGTTRRQADDYFGYHVNLTARLAETAAGGQVLATANVLAGVDLPALALVARPAGELSAKGVSGPVDLFDVERLAEPCDRWRQLAG
jgi:class 3 adenylate cyclase